MSEAQTPTDRLAYAGDLASLIERVAEVYGVGTPTSHSVVEVGYEDCNVIIDTEQDRFLAKMFAKTRKPEEITRYTDIMQKVSGTSVHHPELMTANGDIVYADSGLALC